MLCRVAPSMNRNGETEVKRFFFFTPRGSLVSFTRAKAQWIIHGVN